MLMRHRLRISFGGRVRERVALAAMYRIAAAHVQGDPPWSVSGLAAELGVAEESLSALLDRLEDHRLLLGTENGGLVPGRDIHRIRLTGILEAVRATDPDLDHPEATLQLGERIDRLATEAEQALYARLDGQTLAALLEEDPERRI